MNKVLQKNNQQIKDFKIILKDFETILKTTDHKGRSWLINGNNLDKKTDNIGVDDGSIFNLRYREGWANWLLCAVLRKIDNADITFQDDLNGDGIIFNKSTKKWFATEHVCAMDFKNGPELPKGEDRILWAINEKIRKDQDNPGYADNKTLVVFTDGVGEWYPNKVGKEIESKHNFVKIYCIGFIKGDDDGYSYGVTEFKKDHSPTFRVDIKADFTDWEVSQIQ